MSSRLLTVPEAATRVGVLPQRVRALVQAGALDAVRAEGVWLVDANSVARRRLLADLGVTSSSARPWSERVAWAAMRSLDGDDVPLAELDPTDTCLVVPLELGAAVSRERRLAPKLFHRDDGVTITARD